MKFRISAVFLFLILIISLEAVGQEAHIPNLVYNIDTAKARANESGQAVLMVFAGSDWCRPCMMFKKDILASARFAEYAPNHLQVLYLDFPSRRSNQLPDAQKAHNEALAEKYNQEGNFPRIILLDADEKMLGELHFTEQSPEAFINELNTLLNSNHQ